MGIDKEALRRAYIKSFSEWNVRHPFSVEEVWYRAGEMRTRHDASPPLDAPGDAKGPWFPGLLVHFGTGVEDHAAEGEGNVERPEGGIDVRVRTIMGRKPGSYPVAPRDRKATRD